MSVNKRSLPSAPLGTHIITDSSVTSSTQVISDGAVTIYAVYINNLANSVKSYVKIYNTDAPTPGTTEPKMILMAPAGKSLQYSILEGATFGAACSYRCTTAGGTAGTGSPDTDVSIAIIADA